MKPVIGIYGQELSLMQELKAATFAAHARLQATPFFAELAACKLPLESYVGQLRALAIIHGVLEPALESSPEPRVAAVWRGDLRKLPLLQQDLRYFEPRAVADLRESVEAALKIAGQLRLLSLQTPLALLGWLYVLEGATLGAEVLRPMFARAFLLVGHEGLAYLTPYGPAVETRWAQFQQRMNALALSAAERAPIVHAACDFFKQLETIFRALYPFSPGDKTFRVTSINPDAGRHAIPAEPGEVRAAIRAGDLCWERFPYFEARYGERGRRFARSDAAWQATLSQFDPAQISQQVRWLARVLAGRGMPTLLLQVQLEILVAELTAAFPAKKSEYEKLLPAAAELREARRRHLSDAQLQAIADAFDHAVGSEWRGRFPQTGSLLACAVADELEGSERAVTSLRSWMTDATRFPAEWLAAVDAALAQARQQARAKAGDTKGQG